MPQAARTYSLHDIADILGYSYDYLARPSRRRALYDNGFPRRLNLPGPLRWSAAAVDIFIETGGAAAADDTDAASKLSPGKSPQPNNVVSLDLERQRIAHILSATH